MSIQLFKRANDKSSSEKDSKDPKKQKWNAGAVCVKIGDEYVPLSELAKLANSYVPVQKVENEIEIDGANHDINELIGMYRASKQNSDDNSDKNDPALQAGIKGMKKFAANKKDDEKENTVAGAVEDNKDLTKENAEDGQEELEKGEEEGAKKTVVQKGKNKKMKDNETPAEKGDKGAVAKENAEEDDNEKENEMEDDEMKDNAVDEDEDVKEKIMKQSKSNSRDTRHFIRLNSARENGDAGGATLTIDTMHNRVDRGRNKYGSGK